MNYRPRTQSKKWLDGDCPPGVLAIYDTRTTIDRYTVFYKALTTDHRGGVWISSRHASEDPFHPQGVGLYHEQEAYEVAAFRNRSSRSACKWSDLPVRVQDCVRADLS